MLPKSKWDGLVKTVAELGLASLPEQVDESFLKTLHHILLETHIEQLLTFIPSKMVYRTCYFLRMKSRCRHWVPLEKKSLSKSYNML
ncbi:3815_t:CDS:2 [Paraglomus occultum]|uniref:3815_t:CDS:1 n=1 Tax=Paraglomus occultum TaxID=144539 RepID=A0A9N9FMP1_9GLOM|nr:3815_t:CDS:2 [Paraglomus occultum]